MNNLNFYLPNKDKARELDTEFTAFKIKQKAKFDIECKKLHPQGEMYVLKIAYIEDYLVESLIEMYGYMQYKLGLQAGMDIATGKSILDLSKIDNIELDGINLKDAPDYADAYIVSADYKGVKMTEKELDNLNENYSDFVHEQVLNRI